MGGGLIGGSGGGARVPSQLDVLPASNEWPNPATQDFRVFLNDHIKLGPSADALFPEEKRQVDLDYFKCVLDAIINA